MSPTETVHLRDPKHPLRGLCGIVGAKLGPDPQITDTASSVTCRVCRRKSR